MNLLREVVGDPVLNYYGASYHGLEQQLAVLCSDALRALRHHWVVLPGSRAVAQPSRVWPKFRVRRPAAIGARCSGGSAPKVAWVQA